MCPITPATPRKEAQLLAKIMSQLLAWIMSQFLLKMTAACKNDVTVACKNVTPMCEEDATINFQNNVHKVLV